MSTVYKYCDARGVSIIENLELKITPPNQFNDPFEFTPRMICTNSLRSAVTILRNPKHLKHLFQMLVKEGKFKGSFRDFQNHLKFHRHKIAKDLSEFIPLSAASVRKNLLDKTSKIIGILCLSQRRDSILMWGHYCNRYQGIVIGFDDSHSIFHPTNGRGLRSVKYVHERVVFDATWDMADPNVNLFDELITFSKNKDWEYEREVRQTFKLPTLNPRPLNEGTPGYFLPVPPEALMTVTLGSRCADDVEAKIRSLLSHAKFSHVKIDRAMLHDSEFTLVFEQ